MHVPPSAPLAAPYPYVRLSRRCAQRHLPLMPDVLPRIRPEISRSPPDATDPRATFPKKVAQGSVTLTRYPTIACVASARPVPLFSRRGVCGTGLVQKPRILGNS